jgi:MFS family permease
MMHKLRLHYDLVTTIRQEIRELYASVAFADMATALAVLFEPIILYKVLGLGIMQILLFMASIYAFQIVLLPLGAKIAARFGYMHAIFLSIPFMVLYWLLLYTAQADFNLLYLAPIVYGIEKALFWPAFHASAARFANAKPTTPPTASRDGLYAMVLAMRILGPVIGGFVAFYLGLQIVLLLAAAMYMTSLLPLLVSKEVYSPARYKFDDTWQIYKAYPKRFLNYLGTGEEVIIMSIWPIFIYIYTGNVALTGLVVTASAAVTALLILAIKRPEGLASKLLLIKLGTFIYTLANLLRLAVSGFYGLFIADALGRSTKELISLPLTTLTYERAQKTKILPYVVFYQQSAALGKFLAAVLAVVVFGATGSLLAVFILAGAFTMLYMLD